MPVFEADPDDFSDLPEVTVGVRFHDFKQLPLLERALMSVNAQCGVRMNVIIALQGFRPGEVSVVEQASGAVLNAPTASVQILNIANPNDQDLRAVLLNRICDVHYEMARSEFLAFIDFDDVWFKNALSTLVDALQKGKAVLSYADIHCADVYYDSGQVYLKDIKDNYRISGNSKRSLLKGNFLPLHSYMFHTGRLSREELRYDETLLRLEDYDLLLRIAAKYPFSGMYRNRLVGLYNFYTTRSGVGNSSASVFSDQVDVRDFSEWRDAERKIVSRYVGMPWNEFWGEDWLAAPS